MDDVADLVEPPDEVIDQIVDDAAPDLPPSIPPGMDGGSCQPNSFVAGTPVLMADGTHKPIEQVRVGDLVRAADPVTGHTAPRPVVTLIRGDGTKTLVEITIDLDGPQGITTDQITATDAHPFWLPQLRRWLPASALQPGMWLQTSAGTWVQITAIRTWSAQQDVYNLNVRDLHTYFVLAGDRAILVHNTNPGNEDAWPNIVWRALRPGEDPALGLTARDPRAVVDPLSHVAGKRRSPWISTSKLPEVAFDKYNGGNGIVAIDLARVPGTIADVSSGFPGKGRVDSYAKRIKRY